MFSEGPGCQPKPGFESSKVSAVAAAPPPGEGVPPVIVTLLEPAGPPGSSTEVLHRREPPLKFCISPQLRALPGAAPTVYHQVSTGSGPATSVRPLGITKLRG